MCNALRKCSNAIEPGNRFKDKNELLYILKKVSGVESISIVDVDDSGLVADKCLIVGDFCKNHGYIDIFYLDVPYGDLSIYVTEVSVYDE